MNRRVLTDIRVRLAQIRNTHRIIGFATPIAVIHVLASVIAFGMGDTDPRYAQWFVGAMYVWFQWFIGRSALAVSTPRSVPLSRKEVAFAQGATSVWVSGAILALFAPPIAASIWTGGLASWSIWDGLAVLISPLVFPLHHAALRRRIDSQETRPWSVAFGRHSQKSLPLFAVMMACAWWSVPLLPSVLWVAATGVISGLFWPIPKRTKSSPLVFGPKKLFGPMWWGVVLVLWVQGGARLAQPLLTEPVAENIHFATQLGLVQLSMMLISASIDRSRIGWDERMWPIHPRELWQKQVRSWLIYTAVLLLVAILSVALAPSPLPVVGFVLTAPIVALMLAMGKTLHTTLGIAHGNSASIFERASRGDLSISFSSRWTGAFMVYFWTGLMYPSALLALLPLIAAYVVWLHPKAMAQLGT